MLIKLTMKDGVFWVAGGGCGNTLFAYGDTPEGALLQFGTAFSREIRESLDDTNAEQARRQAFADQHPGHEVLNVRHHRCGHDALHAYLPGDRDLAAGMILNNLCPACGGAPWVRPVLTEAEAETEAEEDRKLKVRLDATVAMSEDPEALLIADLVQRGLWKTPPAPGTTEPKEGAQ
jgi:hypothetical protein